MMAAVSAALVLRETAWAASGAAFLKRFTAETTSAAGRFTQVVTDKKGEAVDAPAEGTFAFLRPGFFAWRTETPYVSEIVADGTTVKLWDRDLNQVTVKSMAGAVAAAPAALLFGDAKALEAFTLTESPLRLSGAIAAVRALPKTEDPAFAEVTAGFDAAGLPVFMKLTDHFGTVTTVTLSKVQKNPPLTPQDFVLNAPADADVLEDRTGSF